jgi:predicted ATP-grasp superfamily ATP-dependent carboligase
VRALIVEDGWQRGALAACRALGQAGWTVGIASPQRAGLAASSRFAAAWHHVPAPERDAERFLEATGEAIAQGRYEIVFPAGDAEAVALSSGRGRLGAVVPYGPHEDVVRAFDKVRLAEAGERAGFAVPATAAATGDLGRLGVPVVVKPRLTTASGSGGETIRLRATLAYDVAAAAERAEVLRGAGAEPLLQSHVSGELAAYVCVVDREGRLVTGVEQRAQRVWPPNCGGSVRAVTVASSEHLRAKVQALLAELNWFGLAQVQFQAGEDKEAYLIDLNGRFYGSMALALAAGPNLPEIWALMAMGERVRPVKETRIGVRYHWLEADLRRALAERRGGLVGDVADCLRYAAQARHGLWDARDPVPAASYYGRLAFRSLRKLR